jgi:hypothetical protein
MYITRPELNVTYYSSVETNNLKYGVFGCSQGRKDPTEESTMCVCFVGRKPCSVLGMKNHCVKNRKQVPFSLVLGANRRGHLVREYEKTMKETRPMDDEIIICVDSQGPSYFTNEKDQNDIGRQAKNDGQVGGEPGGSPIGSSYADAMVVYTGKQHLTGMRRRPRPMS